MRTPLLWFTLACLVLAQDRNVPVGDRSSAQKDWAAAEAALVALCEKVIPTTVGLQIDGSAGSGVIVSADGLVLTAAHVFPEPGKRVRILLPDGRRLEGLTLGKMNDDDYGVVRITTKGSYPFAPMGVSKDLKEGAPCLATGHPGGFQAGRQPVVRFGTFTNATRNALRTTCVIEQGDSGGPLFNLKGEVIGIHSRISTGQAQNFHIPIDFYTQNWERLISGKEWPAGLGIRGEDGSSAETQGCRVLSVEPSLGAAKAGLQPDDLIIAAGESPINGIRGLQGALAAHSADDEIAIVLLRGQEKLTLNVKLGALR
ncbi:MAG TPA: S1C family serine protease [Planctomycetota bacterium]|jgi:serine protease Do|nr:S1C family serine protease [Planctomycetota bacterium]